MTFDKQRVKNLMHADLITLNNGKNSSKTAVIWSSIAFAVMGLFVSPLMGLYCPLIVGCMFSIVLFQIEAKNHSDRMFGLLPIARHELVISRFLLTTGIETVFSIAFYFLMLIAIKLKFYSLIPGWIDTMSLFADLTSFTEMGLFNLLYFGVYSFTLILNGATLRKGFKEDSEIFSSDMALYTKGNKGMAYLKRDLTYVGIIIGVLVLIFLSVNGVLPLGPVFSVIAGVISQLANAANGFIMGLVMLITGILSSVYLFICSVCEYDDKELKG